MTVLEAVGDIIGPVIPSAGGVPLCLRYWRAVTFVSFEDDGSTILTFTQHPTAVDGTADTGSEASLGIQIPALKVPGVGGAATRIASTAANWTSAGTLDLADDTVNDSLQITVRADQLSDGYEFIECSTDGGIVIAILHAPRHKLPVDAIPSPLVAP